jgi:hypothetical protein
MTLDVRTELLRVVNTLKSATVEYAVAGGLAVAIYGYPRATRDMDLLVQEKDLKRIEHAVAAIGYTQPSGILPFDAGKKTERRIFRISKAEGEEFLTLDLILLTPLLERIWATRKTVEISGEDLTVVSREGLLEMKRIAGRPQDIADISKLEAEE